MLLPKLLDRQSDLLPGATAEICVAVGERAGHPIAPDPRIRHGAVERIDLDLHGGTANVASCEVLMPVPEMIDRDAPDRIDLARAAVRRDGQQDTKRSIGAHITRGAVTAAESVLLEDLTGRRAERSVSEARVDLKEPPLQRFVQERQSPDGLPRRVMRGREGARTPQQLGIARQLVNELGVHDPEHPLDDSTEPRLGRRTLQLAHLEVTQSRLEIERIELSTLVNDQAVGDAVEAGDSVEENFRERNPTGVVERERHPKRQARPRIDHQRHPGTTDEPGQRGPRHQLDVELRVIDMSELEDAIGNSRKPIDPESKRPLDLIAGAGALAGVDQRRSVKGLQFTANSLAARRRNVDLIAESDEPVDRSENAAGPSIFGKTPNDMG